MNGFLAITYAFMLAYCPYYNVAIGQTEEKYNNPTYASIQIGVELFDCVNLYASEETYQVSNIGIVSWLPYTQSYWVGIEYHKKFNDKLTLKTGYKHMCQHPTNCWETQLSNYNISYSQLYVGIEGKVDIF